MNKICLRCQVQKPLDDFYRAAGCKDGRRRVCKECILAERRAKHAANPEKNRERDRARYADSPERQARQRATAKAFYHADKPRQRELRKAYYRANRDRWVQWRAERQARFEDGRPREHYTRRMVYDRGEGHCAICGVDVPYEPGGFHIDHVIPIVHGGADTLANLQLTCPPCNWSKWTSIS